MIKYKIILTLIKFIFIVIITVAILAQDCSNDERRSTKKRIRFRS
jgi:hypothetical protein